MTSEKLTNFVLLVILDGWGIAPAGAGNAIQQANPTNMNRFWASYPHTQLKAAGEAVGLPHGEAGNTETGHLNIGAGRIVYQDLERINISIADGSFYDNKVLTGAIEHAQKNNSNLHYMGLIGAGGVHSSINHLYSLLHMARVKNFQRVYLHLFTDGRDSPPTSAKTYINQLKEVMKKEGIGQIATIMGRYWAMDRDQRWERTEKAYNALTRGEGHLVKTVEEAIDMSLAEGKTDEFIEPAILSDANGQATSTIKDNDAVVFFNFRIDRPRQLSRAFCYPDFTKVNTNIGFDPYSVEYGKHHEGTSNGQPIASGEPFSRQAVLKNLYFVTMTEYDRPITEAGAHVAFPPEKVDMPLGRAISEAGMQQIRMCESEKERFVTFYLNGQQEVAFTGERRVIIPSPKVPTYDQKPEMSAREITSTLLNELQSKSEYALAVVNFANADMVGHTGNIGATVAACQVLDECIGKIANFILGYGGTLLITADHGNAESKINPQTGEISTEHTTSPVPFIAVSQKFLGKPVTLQEGILADIAPTILGLLGIEQPGSMTGRNLLANLEF